VARRRKSFGDHPAVAAAKRGDCSAAKSALASSKAGIGRDYAAGLVEEYCSIGTRGADLSSKRNYFGAFAVRQADSKDRSKWVVKKFKTLAVAEKAAKLRSHRAEYPVCVFDLSKWEALPKCFLKGNPAKYREAPHGIARPNPTGTLKRLAYNRSGIPDVAHDRDWDGNETKLYPRARDLGPVPKFSGKRR
jgi:hypothetical protein